MQLPQLLSSVVKPRVISDSLKRAKGSMKMIYNIYIIRKKPVFRVARDHRQMESSKLNLRQGARRVSKRVTFTLGRLVSLCGSGNWPTAIKSGNWKRNRAGSEPFAAATKPSSLTSSPILRGSRLRSTPTRHPKIPPSTRLSLSLSRRNPPMIDERNNEWNISLPLSKCCGFYPSLEVS